MTKAVLDIIPGDGRNGTSAVETEDKRLEILRRFNDLMAADMTVRVDVGDDDMEAARRWYMERARLEVAAETRHAGLAEAAD